MFRKTISMFLIFGLFFQQAGFAQIAAELNIAGHLSRMASSLSVDKFRPLHLRYFSYDQNSDNFKFLFDKGDQFSASRGHFPSQPRGHFPSKLSGSSQKESVPWDEAKFQSESQTLLKYFFIGITLPDSKFWVNLRPDSEDQIIEPELAQTDLGKVLLEADLELKKDTARYTSPETPEGKEYWNKLYKKAEELFGYENITIPTLTRPWIVPGEIILRETSDSSFIYKSTLKVMLESDYLSSTNSTNESRGHFPSGLLGNAQKESVPYAQYEFKDSRLKVLNEYSTQLIKETIIPKLTKEVNTSKKYANLRQVFYSLILARWFKARYGLSDNGPGDTFRQSYQGVLKRKVSPGSAQGTVPFYVSLINSGNLNGLTSKEPWSKATYFKAYQKSFTEGEYNLKEQVYTPTGQIIRSYFSGGFAMTAPATTYNGLRATGDKNLPKSLVGITASPVEGSILPNLVIGGQEIGNSKASAAGSPVQGNIMNELGQNIRNTTVSIAASLRGDVAYHINDIYSRSSDSGYRNSDFWELEHFRPVTKEPRAEWQVDPFKEILVRLHQKAQSLKEYLGQSLEYYPDNLQLINSIMKDLNDALTLNDANIAEYAKNDKDIDKHTSLFRAYGKKLYEAIDAISKWQGQIDTIVSQLRNQRAPVIKETAISGSPLDSNEYRFGEDSYEPEGENGGEFVARNVQIRNGKDYTIPIPSALIDFIKQELQKAKAEYGVIGQVRLEEVGGVAMELTLEIGTLPTNKNINFKEIGENILKAATKKAKELSVGLPINAELKGKIEYSAYILADIAESGKVILSLGDSGMSITSPGNERLAHWMRDADFAFARSGINLEFRKNNPHKNVAIEFSQWISADKIKERLLYETGAAGSPVTTVGLFYKFLDSLRSKMNLPIPQYGEDMLRRHGGGADVRRYKDEGVLLQEFIEYGLRNSDKFTVFHRVEFEREAGQIVKDYYKGSSPLTNSETSSPVKTGGIDASLRSASMPEEVGGIDFRVMNIVTQPLVASSSLNLKLPQSASLAKINLDEEFKQLQNMVSAGITPSGERIKEFMASSALKGEWDRRIPDIISCLMDVCRLEEDDVSDTPVAIREALIIADAGLS
ncbi:MAG: hypothetical protein Q7K98_06030 [Candidatus Omnitrophota bacterium]|nr:hypothetical protein [Candidatus Omnitrophota bacterium]